MKGVTVTVVCPFVLYCPGTSILTSASMFLHSVSLGCPRNRTLYIVMRPLASLHRSKRSHWTVMAIEFTTDAMTLRGDALAPAW